MAKRVEHISTIVLDNSDAGSIPAGSVGLDLNLQKPNYQCLTTSVAVVLVDTLMATWFCSVFNVVCVVNVCPVHAVDLN